MTMRIIGWAIVHSLWLGGVIALVAGAMLAAARKLSPELRYGISLGALALMLVLPLGTAWMTEKPTSTIGTELPEIGTAASTPNVAASATLTSTAGTAPARGADISPAPLRDRFVFVSGWVDGALPWLVAAWMLGLLLSSARLIGGFTRSRRITRRSTSVASRALEIRLARICDQLGVTRFVRTLESTAIDVPLVIGAIRPVIVVPASLITGLTPLQLDMLLAHELAHVRRHDYLVNLVQTVVETMLFYHPAARWISDRAREERENCCDDIAIAACGADPAQYTTTLLVLEQSRGEKFGLAAAANGGSLLRRAQRILTGTTPYIELGPRWIAGVVTIGAALFIGRDAFAGIRASYTPAFALVADHDSTEKKRDRSPDMSRAAPGPVTKAPLGNPLAERWRWAERSGGSGTYWIGYLVGGDQTGRSRYYTSDLPVRLEGGVTISGRMSFGGGDISNMIFHGVPLAPIFGAHSPMSTAIFVLVSNGVTGKRVDRVHLGSYGLPQYFDRRAVMWLDSAADGESLALLRSLMSNARDNGTRSDLVAAIGIHRDEARVPILVNILGSGDVAEVRSEAAEWLGRSRDPRAMTALSNAARRDRSKDVRDEAVEAFGHMDTPAATDTLIAFSSTITERDIRRTAIEALGHRADDRALSHLTAIVHSRESHDIKDEALEALAEMPGGRGMNAVIDLAQRAPDPGVRRKAAEEVANIEPTSRALDILNRIVANDADESVRAEAAETIAQVQDPRAVRILAQIVATNSSSVVQVEAVEALGETVDPRSAMSVLQEIARNHPLAEARKKALETIAEFRDETNKVEFLVRAARSDRDEAVRREALESLGESHDAAGLKALETIVRSNESLELRERALDVYANSAYAIDAIRLLKSVIASDMNIELRVRAVELLDDVEGDAGRAALREVARSAKDQRLRNRAAEILDDN